MKHIQSIKYGILFSILFIFLSACTDNDYFGNSEWNEIKEFTVPGQSGATVISKTNDTVTLTVGNGVDLTELTPSVFEVSNFASVIPGKTETRDFSDPVEYVVRAENGSERIWTVTIDEIGENPQLSNSDFDLWYDVPAGIGGTKRYFQPGESSSNTIWATANEGLTILNADAANTTPADLGSGNFASKMTTTAAPALVRIAAATTFTGTFDKDSIDINDPRKSTLFGTPFTSRPTGFRVKYVYVPGGSNEDADGDPVGYGDQCDIYVLLEKRDGDDVARIGTGWFRDGTDTDISEWIILDQEIKYGELEASEPEFEYANIRAGETWADANETPTHISVVFSSSAKGDIFEGAIDSTLVVDDFELLYE